MSISAGRPLPTTASRPTSPLKYQTSKAKQTSLETLSDSLASNLNESPSRPPSAYINKLKNTELLHGNSSKSLKDEAEAERTVVYSSNTNLSTVLGSIVNVEMKLGEKKTSPAVPGITYSMPFLYLDKRDSISATNNRPPSAGRGSLSRGGSAGTNSSGPSSVRIPSASFENIGGGGSLSVSEAMDQGMLLIQKASSTTRNSSGGKKSIQTRATPSPASIEWQLQKSKSEQTHSHLPSALEATNDIIDAGIYTQEAALPSSSPIEPISAVDSTPSTPVLLGTIDSNGQLSVLPATTLQTNTDPIAQERSKTPTSREKDSMNQKKKHTTRSSTLVNRASSTGRLKPRASKQTRFAIPGDTESNEAEPNDVSSDVGAVHDLENIPTEAQQSDKIYAPTQQSDEIKPISAEITSIVAEAVDCASEDTDAIVNDNHLEQEAINRLSSPLPLRYSMNSAKLGHYPALTPVGAVEAEKTISDRKLIDTKSKTSKTKSQTNLSKSNSTKSQSSLHNISTHRNEGQGSNEYLKYGTKSSPRTSRTLPAQPPTSTVPSQRPSIMSFQGPPVPRTIPPLYFESKEAMQEIRKNIKQVLPKISALEAPHHIDNHLQNEGGDYLDGANQFVLNKSSSPMEQRGAIPTVVKALMKRSKMEVQMWRYAGMSDAKRFIYLQNKLRVEEFLQQTKNLKNLQKLHEQKEKAAAQALEVDRKTSQIPLFKPKPMLPQRIDTTPAVEKFLATIPSDDPVKAMHCLRTQFVKDFAVLEDLAVKEYQNFWDMRVRNTDIVAHFSLKPYSLAETTQMAWQSYTFLRSLENPIFEYDVAKRLLIVVETDWSMQDKLFEIQKMVAKLPKETFLILKSTLTHLCRICVVQKSDHHLFRPLSNVFAPVMMRIPSRKNSVQREEEYLARNPSQSIYNRESIVSNRTRNMDSEDARKCEGTQAEDENQSYDSLSNWKDNESSIVEIGPSSNAEVDFLETKAIEAATNQAIESDAKPTDENYPKTESKAASTAITNESATTRGGGRTTVASSSLAIEPRYPHSIVSRSTRHGKRHRYSKTVISTMHTGIASSAPEIENLWDDLDHVKHSIGFRSPTNDPSARESRITIPNSNSIVIPAASPFSRASIVSRKAEEDEEQFNEWVQNQMAQAAKLYRERKYPESKIQAAIVEKPQEKLPQPNRLPRPLLQVPDGEWSDSAKNLFSMEDPEDSDMMPQVFTELICAGIKIIITPPPALDQEEIISEYYMANSLRDENVSASHLEELMDSLTADPAIPPETVIDAAAVQDGKEPETITAPDTPLPVIPEPTKLMDQNTSFGNLEFGPGDVDGFGWNWMTQKKLATQLFLTEECQTASAALLELMLKNLDVIFDWNMYIASERARADLHSINL